MFRLVRRLLFCVILGVTAFGVAGWLAMPRPRWTTTIGSGLSNMRFAPRCDGSFKDDEPVWLEFSTVELGSRVRQFAESRNAADGQRIRLLEDCKPVHGVRAEGVLITQELDRNPYTSISKTTFAAIGAQPNDAPTTATFDGEWVTSNGGRAWKQKATLQGLTISIADLATMSVVRSRLIPGNFVSYPQDFTISYDARLIAVSDRTKQSRKPPYGFEVLDLETGDVVFRASPQQEFGDGGGRYGFLSFSLDNKSLLYVWHFDRTARRNTVWKLDLATSTTKQVSLTASIEPPEGFAAPPGRSGQAARRVGGVWIFEAPNETWFRVEAERDAKAPWRKVPFVVGEATKLGRQVKGAAPESPPIAMIPERTELVWTNREPPLTSMIPQPVRRFAPTSWQNDQAVLKHRWHDWNTGEWRDAGAPQDVVARQMRPHSMLTLSQNASGAVMLQSWPLPPRDPKWPAAGAGAAAFGLTWLICRLRAKRKLTVGA